MLALKSYEQSNGFSAMSTDELYFVNGGSGISSSLISNGQYYMQLGTSCATLGAQYGNPTLAGFGAISFAVGAAEAAIGYLAQNSSGDTSAAMAQYYEHH